MNLMVICSQCAFVFHGIDQVFAKEHSSSKRSWFFLETAKLALSMTLKD